MTRWTGTWRNQYGSTVRIDDEDDGLLLGAFRSAIEGSPFAGYDAPIRGAWHDDAMAFVCAARDVPVVVSYTGKLKNGALETLWIVLDGSAPWWSSATTNHDTFQLV